MKALYQSQGFPSREDIWEIETEFLVNEY